MGTYKVVIVEDDPMVAMINEQYITQNKQFSVAAVFRNGQDALQYLEKNRVDLIVLDVYMPYMDGIETLKRIRGNNYQTEVIMVTAANDTMTLEQTINLRAVDYLIKPFAMERFSVALEKFLAKVTALNEVSVLDQSKIDSIISGKPKTRESEPRTYPKGIQEKTLQSVQAYFERTKEWISGDMVAAELGLSIVTIRHYLNYLVKTKYITKSVNYETGGRPSMLYKTADQKTT